MYEVFEQLLQKFDVTTYQVCKATGISQSTISNWKSRKNLISGKNAQLIADYFGVSVDYLMTGKEPNTPSQQGALLAEFAFKYMDMVEEFMKLSDDEQNGVKEIIHLFSVKYK